MAKKAKKKARMAEENEQTTDVVVELEETPEVGHEGTVGHQATTAEMKAYAKSLLADEYDLTPKGQNVRQGEVIPGTDMPKDEHPDWGILGLALLLAGRPETATMNFDRTTVGLVVNLLGIPVLKMALKHLRAARICRA